MMVWRGAGRRQEETTEWAKNLKGKMGKEKRLKTFYISTCIKHK
jgi:hypothetical protein